MPTYKLTIEYEGTRYSGWQAQGNTQKTVQGHLIKAATAVLGEADLGGAGRTDAGVHAAGQVAHLRARKVVDPLQLSRKINDLLPHDICVLRAARAGDAFHARHDAVSRVYLYQIATRRTAFAKSFVWWVKDRLDAKAMGDAAARLAGRHDFSAFTDKRLQEDESRVVVVGRSDVAVVEELILFRIEASHFLWRMVRKLVAFLADGLQSESVSYLAAEPDARSQIVAHLERRRPSIEADVAAGLLVLSEYAASTPAQLDFWETTFNAAATAGARSLRVVGDVSGGLGKRLAPHELVEYEQSYDKLRRRFGVDTLCLYDVRHSSGLDVLDVLRVHRDVFRYPVERLFS